MTATLVHPVREQQESLPTTPGGDLHRQQSEFVRSVAALDAIVVALAVLCGYFARFGLEPPGEPRSRTPSSVPA